MGTRSSGAFERGMKGDGAASFLAAEQVQEAHKRLAQACEIIPENKYLYY